MIAKIFVDLERPLAKLQSVEFVNALALEKAGLTEQFWADVNHPNLDTHLERMAKYDNFSFETTEAVTVGTEEFVARHFEIVENLDGYGGAIVVPKGAFRDKLAECAPNFVGRKMVIFNTYGDEDSERHLIPRRTVGEIESRLHYTLCMFVLSVDETTAEFVEVADFYNDDKNGLRIERHFTSGPLGEKVADLLLRGDFRGKRGFYLYLDPPAVSIRCSEDGWVALPAYHHDEYSPSSTNLSAPRLLFPLIEVLGE